MDDPSAHATDSPERGRVFRHDPPRLAVTGGIGSGKSTALAFLAELGAATLSSDAIVHEVYRSPEIVQALAGRFGSPVVTEGQVNRAALSNAVFADDDALSWLERLTHPLVRRRVEEWARRQGLLTPPPALLAVEVPLLFESAQMLDLFDWVLLITAPVCERRRRLAAKLTREDFDRRAARQMSDEEKAERSDFVYRNTGSRAALRDYLCEVVAAVLAWAENGGQAEVDGVVGLRAGDLRAGDDERDDETVGLSPEVS